MSVSGRQSGRILSAALLLPLILFSALGTGFALWRCNYDGVARASCCCPAKPVARHGPQAQPRLTMSRARCCDLEQHQLNQAPAEAARGQATRLADLLAATASAVPVSPFLIAPPPARFAPANPHPGDDPPAGRSLVVQKQSFLI
jgi:hypothetical protein